MVVETIQDKLAKRIFDREEFTQDYESLLMAEFTGSNRLPIESIKRLLQASAIFATTSERPENDRFRRLSYNIVVYLINKYSDEYDGLMKIAQNIFIRLGNFPAVKMCVDDRKATDYYSIYLESEEVVNPFVNRHILIKASQNQFSFRNTIDYFTDFQAQVYKHLSEGKSISYSAPTSAGKSFILGHYISKIFGDTEDLCVVYVVPTRALINQVQLTLSNQFMRLAISDVAVFTSSLQVIEQGVGALRKKMFVLTQERLKNLLFETDSKEIINVLIVDEAQKIGEDARGILLEEVVATVIEQNPSVQLIFLSPFARNPRKLPEIFGVEETTEIESTALSPVSQNIFYVELNKDKADVYLAFPEKKERLLLRTYNDVPNLSSGLRKKVWLASHFHSESNIVYCNSPNECRKVAKLLAEEIENDYSKDKEISEAIQFIAGFIHPDYYLIDYLKKGIGYHYGKMPTLVRLLVEDLFKSKKLAYICCTSTLLEGVNLPAQNIFLYKPTKGISNPIDKLSFWNLAGRAGRLLKDFYGNIYCLNVQEWSGYKPEIENIEHEIESAFETTIIEKHSVIIEYLKDLYEQEKLKGEAVEAVVTRFIIGELKEGNDRFIEELLGRNAQLDENNLNEIRQAVISICTEIKVPAIILEGNSNIDPRRQNELYLQLCTGELPVPTHPGKSEFWDSLFGLFDFITKFFMGKPLSTGRVRYLTNLASQWVREKSLNELIRNKIQYVKVQSKDDINKAIEELLKDLEKEIRFEYLKYMKCYITIQSFVYDEKKWDKSLIAESLPHYLELGAFKPATLMLQSIGVSRSSAITITRKFDPLFADIEDCKKWLNDNLNSLKQELTHVAYKEVLRTLNRYK